MTETADTTVPAAGASESTPNAAGGDTSASNDTGTAPAEQPAVATEAASDTNDSSTTDAGEQLISEDEFEKLQDDPAALRKALQSAYTKKSQQLGPATQLLAALQKDPQGVIRALAKAQGLAIPDSPEHGAVAPIKDEVLDAFEGVLGPESAKLIKPALEKLIDSKIAPYREAHEKQMEKAVVELQTRIESEFTKTRPDWKQHEPKMKALAEKIKPNGLEPLEYLDLLYVASTHEGAALKHAEKLISRITKSASAVAESKVSGAAPTAVSKVSQQRYKTPGDAARAALRGE